MTGFVIVVHLFLFDQKNTKFGTYSNYFKLKSDLHKQQQEHVIKVAKPKGITCVIVTCSLIFHLF